MQSVDHVRARAYWASPSRQQEAAAATSTVQQPPPPIEAVHQGVSTTTARNAPLDSPVEDLSQLPGGVEPVPTDNEPTPSSNSGPGAIRRVSAHLRAERDSNYRPKRRIPIEVDGHDILFDSIWLRDRCNCPKCVDPSTKQKLFQTADIPENIAGFAHHQEGRPYVKFTWKNDVPDYPASHTTNVFMDTLRSAVTDEPQAELSAQSHDDHVLWDRDMMVADNKNIPFDAYMSSNTVLYKALRQLHTHGLLFLHSVPDSEAAVVQIANRIGTLRDSFYGRTWNVRSVPDAKNVAYTHQFLGLHMDLLYMVDPPFLQFLHSLRADSPGGASMFADSFRAAEAVRAADPAAFDALASVPVPYHYKNDGQHYTYARPTVELGAAGAAGADAPVARTNWSPPFQAPFPAHFGVGVGAARLREYRRAAQLFARQIEDPKNMFEYRLSAGECVVFDNRRVLHARREFDATKGERWLKGAYLDEDVFRSRLRVLGERFGRGERAVRKEKRSSARVAGGRGGEAEVVRRVS